MKHYKIHKPEAIDLILRYNLNFIEGNVVKYILRSPFKGDPIGDLEKALYYSLLLHDDYRPRSFYVSELDSYIELTPIEKEALVMTINRLCYNRVMHDEDGNEIKGYKENYIEKLINVAIEERKDQKIQSVTK